MSFINTDVIRLGTLATIIMGCGGESPISLSRIRPMHDDGGMPQPDASWLSDHPLTRGTSIDEARRRFGSGLHVTVSASKTGYGMGCSRIFVSNLQYTARGDDHGVSFTGQGHWDSFPSSYPDTSEVRYRVGGVRSDRYTREYPQYATLGLRYFVTGSYDFDTDQFNILFQSLDVENQSPSAIFFAAIYRQNDIVCQPHDGSRDGFSNEFFVAVPAQEIVIHPDMGSNNGVLCHPCPSPVDQVTLQIR